MIAGGVTANDYKETDSAIIATEEGRQKASAVETDNELIAAVSRYIDSIYSSSIIVHFSGQATKKRR